MVGIKEAVAAAVQFATSVLPPTRTADIRLEEVEAGDTPSEVLSTKIRQLAGV
jgi:hypothetical protein